MSKSVANRRRQVPWLHQHARQILGAIAILGTINTAYLTYTKLAQVTAVCTGGCERVLSSPYATVLGKPLALFGLLAYFSMATLALLPLGINSDKQKKLRTQLEDATWLLLFAGATAMLIFSGYLMNIMVSKFVVPFGLDGICYYCIGSAVFALGMFTVTLLGRSWEDMGQLFMIGAIVGMVTLIGTLGIYAPIDGAQKNIAEGLSFPVDTTSGDAEIQLADHLTKIGAKMYGAYWCSHCHEQKELFGKDATAKIPYVECAEGGKKAEPATCTAAGVKGFPTWDINGKKVEGAQSLQKLAEMSRYPGPQTFKNGK
jgi:uncharacterized membrane protein